MKEDYDSYRFSLKEWIIYGGAGVAGGMAGCWLLYDTFWPMLLFPAVAVWYFRELKTYAIQKRKERLKASFLPAAESFVAALRAGYSAEKAVTESRRDMQRLSGTGDLMVQELKAMEKQLHVGTALEVLFQDLADRSGVEDIGHFARVFAAGKRTGGDLDQILTMTLQHMKQKMETQKDIEAEIASRKMEQRIMSLVPWGILLYLRTSSGDYMAVLYQGMAGRTVMTVCFLAAALADFWGRKITDIQV